jgi:hypothetical protein
VTNTLFLFGGITVIHYLHTISYLEPIIATIIGHSIYKERYHGCHFSGGVLMLVADFMHI